MNGDIEKLNLSKRFKDKDMAAAGKMLSDQNSLQAKLNAFAENRLKGISSNAPLNDITAAHQDKKKQ